jgi:transposase
VTHKPKILQKFVGTRATPPISLKHPIKYFDLSTCCRRHACHDVQMTKRPSDRLLAARYRRLQSVPALAAELGVAFETARRWLNDADVELQRKGRPSKNAHNLDPVVLAKHYASGESIATIGETFGVSPATVRARLIDAGVELRPRRGWQY